MSRWQRMQIRSYYAKQEKDGKRPPVTLPKLKFMELKDELEVDANQKMG